MTVGLNGADRRVVRVRIYGRVQGVGFRYWLARQAEARGIAGWVRNRRDGSVEAVLAGPPRLVAEMLELCGRGPASARVDRLETEPGEADVAPEFLILPTV